MDITICIENLKGKQDAKVIAEYIQQHKDNVNSLMQLLFGKNAGQARKAAWVVSGYCKNNSHDLIPYFPKIVETLKSPIHQALSRNLYLCLMQMEIPIKWEAELFSICMDDLLNSQTEVAVKANAMSVACKIGINIPELRNELQLVLEEGLENSSAAYTARAKMVLKEIKNHKKLYK